MIKVTEKQNELVCSDTLPEHHYFMGEIGGVYGLFAKIYGGKIVFIENPNAMLSSPAKIRHYKPAKKLFLFDRGPMVLSDIPAGTCFKGKTCDVTGTFIKLPNGKLMQVDPDNLDYIQTWGSYAKNNPVENYCPVDLDLEVSV